MTILEVGERLWGVAPPRDPVAEVVSRQTGHTPRHRSTRISLIVAFLAVDAAIFWFGLTMSGMTLGGAKVNSPQLSPAGNGIVLVVPASSSPARQAQSVTGAVIDTNVAALPSTG